jgi:CRP-like cAMP-binding protein
MDRDETLFRMYGRYFPQGAILFSENDPGEEMFYVQSGALKITENRGGERREYTLGPGDITGVEALVSKEARGAMAEVTEDSRLLVFHPQNLPQIVRNGPELSTNIVADLMQSIDRAWDDLRRWQLFFYLDKVAMHIKSAWPSEGSTVSDVSGATGVEEGIVGRIFEELTKAGVLERRDESYAVAGRDALSRLEALQDRIARAGRK